MSQTPTIMPALSLRNFGKAVVIPFLLVATLSACATPEGYVARDGINDPFEERNRKVHAFNKSIDQAILRPASRGYNKVLPPEMRMMVNNFSDNLSGPGLVVNNLLQGNFKGAITNTYRFALNSTLGFAGLVDVAEMAGVSEVDTDFGETLHVVDVIADRGRFGDTIDSVLYDSADSYAQSRLIYLQSRRFALGRSGDATYDDPYAIGTTDPYDDPYEDPYAE